MTKEETKQTVKEAAIEARMASAETLTTYGTHTSLDDFEYLSHDEIAEAAFVKGTKWQSKQSPWISVKEKAGCDTSDDCIVMVANGDIFKAYFSSKNKWMKSNDGHYDEVIDDVVAWFPIPSFDEILEANKDVLERIKEKGD